MEGFWIQVYIKVEDISLSKCVSGPIILDYWKSCESSLRIIRSDSCGIQRIKSFPPWIHILAEVLSLFVLSFAAFEYFRLSLRIIWSDSCGIQRIQTLLPFWIHILTEVLVLLCTLLRSFWIFQTVCCELQLFVQSKRLPPQLSQYISNSPTPCIHICAIITSILRQSTGTSLKWSKWKQRIKCL